MRKAAVSSVVAGLMLLSATSGWSKGVLIAPGPRANAMGAAYVGVADDAYAIYYNPAGLSQIKNKNGAELSVFLVSGDSKGSKAMNNGNTLVANDYPAPSIYPSEPAVYNSKEFKTGAMIPFAAGYTKVQDITLALGVYGSGGGGGKFEDTVGDIYGAGDVITAKADGQYSFIIANISASKEMLANGLMFGVGLDYIMMQDARNIQKSYTKSATSALPAAYSSYALQLDQSASGASVQGVLGLMYRINDQWRVGAVYRTGSKITLSGTAKYTGTGLPASPVLARAGLINTSYQTSYERKYAYPETYGVGVSYDPIKSLTISAGYDMSSYAGFNNEYTYDTQTAIFSNSNVSAGYKDISQMRLGAEYRHNDALSLRAGLQNDLNLNKDGNDLTVTDTNQYDMLYAALGVGYQVGPYVFDLSYCKGMSNTATLTTTAGTTDFEYPLEIIRCGVQYKF